MILLLIVISFVHSEEVSEGQVEPALCRLRTWPV